MTQHRLMNDISVLIDNVLKRPSCYYEVPVAAEAFIIGLLGVARALETGEPLGTSMWRTWKGVQELTVEVPGSHNHRRHLCDEQIAPERKESDQRLMELGPALCARLLQNWPVNHNASTGEKHPESHG